MINTNDCLESFHSQVNRKLASPHKELSTFLEVLYNIDEEYYSKYSKLVNSNQHIKRHAVGKYNSVTVSDEINRINEMLKNKHKNYHIDIDEMFAEVFIEKPLSDEALVDILKNEFVTIADSNKLLNSSICQLLMHSKRTELKKKRPRRRIAKKIMDSSNDSSESASEDDTISILKGKNKIENKHNVPNDSDSDSENDIKQAISSNDKDVADSNDFSESFDSILLMLLDTQEFINHIKNNISAEKYPTKESRLMQHFQCHSKNELFKYAKEFFNLHNTSNDVEYFMKEVYNKTRNKLNDILDDTFGFDIFKATVVSNGVSRKKFRKLWITVDIAFGPSLCSMLPSYFITDVDTIRFGSTPQNLIIII